MNRSILIVICDFLLVSLLYFSDISRTEESSQQTAQPVMATNQADTGKDLTVVMKQALEEERKNRDQLLGELSRTRQAAVQEHTLLGEQEQKVQTYQQQLQLREQEAQQLQQQQANLQTQFLLAQTNVQALNQQLQGTSAEALMSREKLAAMEAEMRKQMEQAASLQKQITQLSQSNQVVLNEKQQLNTQLQVAQAEKRSATQLAERMQDEVKVERAEKAKLAEGVAVLANQSGQLAKEVRENRPLAPNTIFSEFSTNQVEARFDAVRPGFLGESSRHKETQTVLVSDGTNTFALCHVQDTPLSLSSQGSDWEGLTGTLSHESTAFAISNVTFCWPDPRIVLIPVTQAQVKQLGCKVYHVSPDPYKFQDAVLVGAREGYYGQCKFELDLSTPEYLKLDRSFLRGLFGKFNPSRGDLVFTDQGELLGMMANSTYCLMLRSFDSAATFRCGPDVRAQHTGDTLARLYSMVSGLPYKLQ